MEKIKRRVTASGNVIYTSQSACAPTHRFLRSIMVGFVAGSGFLSVGFFLTAGNLMDNLLP